MKIERILINKLKPATYNPRQISTKQYKDLEESIDKFGLVDPIIVNKDMTIIGGHQRYKIWAEKAKQSSIDDITIPCVVLELNKEQERELNIRLNKSGGEWDMDILANEFEIEELKDWGFKEIELGLNIDKIVEGNTEDDHIPEVKESRVKLGDVWELGKHRLMCGDSTKESDVNKLMNGEKADMVFTDPPYGMFLNTNYKRKMSKSFANAKGLPDFAGSNNTKVIGDNEDFKPELITTIFNNFDYCKEIFLWGVDYYFECVKDLKKGAIMVWDKRSNEDGSVLGSTVGSHFELCFSKQKHTREIVRVKWCFIFGTEKEFDRKRHHPTQKPILLSEYFISKYSKKDNIIIDLYLGSGSTLIACEKTNRICYGMELDTKYCDVIIERWEQFTGQKANKCG
jgi:DNA modification methylase